VHFALQLLSAQASDNWGGNGEGLLAHAPILCAALQAMANADALDQCTHLIWHVTTEISYSLCNLLISSWVCFNLEYLIQLFSLPLFLFIGFD